MALALAAGGSALAAGPAAAAPGVTGARASVDLAECPWMDTALSADERAGLLLDASSLGQKYRWLNEQAANTPEQTEFSGVSYPEQVGCTPTIVYTDGPDGVRFTEGVTAFPAQIALASSWNSDLAFDKGAAQAAEAWDKGKAGVLGPGIASGRTPLSGRTAEYLGEDPLLSGTLGAANTQGLEKGDPEKPTLAVLKHYVGNEQETARQTSSSNLDERTLKEAYDLPFEILIDGGAPAGVMCSYNQINGVYGCENPLLNTDLRGQLGFDGYVVSDFGAVHSTADALNAGLDQELNRPIHYTPTLLDAAIADGSLTEATVDTAARNVVRSYIGAGLFDKPAPTTPVADASTPEHKALARSIAEEGSVLLKNDGLLPLDASDGSTIALIGPTVSNTPTNGVSASSVCSMSWPFGNPSTLNCEDVVAPDTAFTSRAAEAGASVVVSNGADQVAAAATAAAADVAIVFGYYRSGEFTDIPGLGLADGGDDLIAAVAAANPNTVVVLETGSATDMPWLDQVDGVLQAWYPGEQQGPALASLLWGDTNPSGKLPMTFPKSLADTPTATPEQYPGVVDADGITQVDYSEGLQIGHKWYDEQGIEPLFEFGHGLSYTSFDYSDLELSTAVSGGAVETTASFTLTNTGSVAGTEVPQVYLTLPESAGEPGKRLVDYDRVSLEPGASQRVTTVISSETADHPYSIWNVDTDAWEVVDGGYTVSVGSSSRALPLSGPVVVDTAGTAPVVTVATSPSAPDGAAGWFVSPVTVTATAVDDVDSAPVVSTNLDGAGWVDGGSVTVSADGAHTIEVRATDAAGTVSAVTRVELPIDRAAPTVSAAADREAGTIVLTASDATSGVGSVEWAPAGLAPAWQSYTGPLPVASAGETIVFRATDVAGIVSEVGSFDYAAAAPTPTPTSTPAPSASPAPGAGSPGGGLASTGFAAGGIAALALLLVAGGAVTVLVRRRGVRSAG
ncbi:glycoside hydrolase family 3 C-terminal domain-containing protein [Herbiconiux sp. CPCC 205716]|uniref:Glycoside hydrolase family 3 C-terminal domain-containing protein n=1 Tax=Herbiconiux gentiana TaxID=2970912 RepID=A0ABT2GH82_9MICO|nr:glycoside hydrolase family 3 C-terminal domain-containing protein [Herbiconiux gentiana]MCS5715461.1 glycoside hydrolase family 3 C-terminal domain-containing protein [Herbiconiux gentiana]